VEAFWAERDTSLAYPAIFAVIRFAAILTNNVAVLAA
jgi:ABC-type proline/glycine betaine transport system permease subunit